MVVGLKSVPDPVPRMTMTSSAERVRPSSSAPDSSTMETSPSSKVISS